MTHISHDPKILSNLIRCVKREIEFRRRVYPMRIVNKKMTEGQARFEIDCMKEICLILHTLERTNLTSSDEFRITKYIVENTMPELKVK